MMYQLKFTWNHVGLFCAILSLNACAQIALLNNELQPSNSHSLSPAKSNPLPSGPPDRLLAAIQASSTPAPVLKEHTTAEIPIQKKFERMAQFFDTADPNLPFLLFYDSGIKQSQVYTASGESLIAYFQESLQKKPGNPEVIFDLSSAYLLAGKPEKTFELTKAFQDSSTPALSVLYNQLMALLKMEKYSEIDGVIKQLLDYSKNKEAYKQPESLYLYLTQIALKTFPSMAYSMDYNFLKNLYDYQLKFGSNEYLALILYDRYSRYDKNFLSGNFLSQLEQAIKLNPNSALYKTAYARELLHQMRFQVAQQVLDEALEMNPQSANSQLTRAQLYLAESKPEEMVIQAFEKVQVLAPKWHYPVILLSDYYFEKKKFKESAETLKKFLDKTKLSMNYIYLKLANSLFYSGNYQEAILNYNLHNETFTSNDLEVILMRGIAYGLLKTSEDRSRAIADFTSLIERSPKPVPTQTANIAETFYWKAHYYRAIAYFEDEQFQKSYEDFAKILALTPNSNDVKYNLTGALGALGRYEEAIKIGLEIPEDFTEIKGVYRNVSYSYAYSVKCEESEKYAKLAGVEPKPCKPPGFTFAP